MREGKSYCGSVNPACCRLVTPNSCHACLPFLFSVSDSRKSIKSLSLFSKRQKEKSIESNLARSLSFPISFNPIALLSTGKSLYLNGELSALSSTLSVFASLN